MNIWDHLKVWIHRKEAEKFGTTTEGKTAVRIIGEVLTQDNSTTEDQFIETISTVVGTTPTLIEVPAGVNEYNIFHQTEDGIVYWGDESVDSSSPALEEGDTLEIIGKNDFEIYMKTSSGTVTVFAVSAVGS